ncbi:conditioned medium-induced protein 4 [Haloparvum sp. PAK95]|uniref:conditioned medium-induced protein 4 n=1 Tax=Haloparvum sp. PAK95 TaxID=3418962 RepID=UPI003D2F0126
MDEKTEELRDIFIDTTGADTVTESQEEEPGSITESDEDGTADRLAELIDAMRAEYEFTTDLDDADYERVVRGFFDGESDETVAADLDVHADTVFAARMDLHLVDEADRDAPFDLDELKRLAVDDVPVDERPAHLDADVDPDTVRHYSAVVDADVESTRANHRFRDEFEQLLTDADLETSHASDVHDDGLEEAAEDIETNVSF